MIVSSKFEVGARQTDGRFYVVEEHERDDGSVERLEYGPVSEKLDHQALADARARVMNAARDAQVLRDDELSVARVKIAAVLGAAVGKGDLSVDDVVAIAWKLDVAAGSSAQELKPE